MTLTPDAFAITCVLVWACMLVVHALQDFLWTVRPLPTVDLSVWRWGGYPA